MIPNGISLGDPSPPSGLNPLLASGDQDTLQLAVLLYRPLVWIGQNIDVDADRSLAATVAAMDGNTRFRVTLKPWRWSDGAPITPDDVLFGWQRIELLDRAGYYAASGQGGIPDRVTGVRAAGKDAVDITLTKSTNPDWFILNGLSLIYPLPRHAWGDIGADAMQLRRLDASLYAVTDGPFRLTELQPGRYVVYAPNKLYGGHTAGLQRLVVVSPDTGAAALHAAQAGATDMARVPYTLWQRVHSAAGFRFYALPEPYGYGAMMLNQNSAAAPFLRDRTVRTALAQAADQQAIIRLAYAGMASENHAPAPADPPAWRSPAARAGNPLLRHDVTAAGAALDAAGWVRGTDGVRRRQGVRLAFTSISGAGPDDAELQMLQVLQASLRQAGIDMSLRLMPYAQLLDLVTGGGTGWSAAILPITTPAMPDGTGYWNTGRDGNWGLNVGHFSDPRLDRLIDDTTTRPGRDALYAYQDYVAAQQPAIFLPQGQQLLMVAARLRGVEDFVNATGLWSPEYLSVDDPACATDRRGAAMR